MSQLTLGARQALVSSLINRSAVVINPVLHGLRGFRGRLVQTGLNYCCWLPPAGGPRGRVCPAPCSRAGGAHEGAAVASRQPLPLCERSGRGAPAADQLLAHLSEYSPACSIKVKSFFFSSHVFLPEIIIEIHTINQPWLFFPFFSCERHCCDGQL